MEYDRITRILHVALALSISLDLLSSLGMEDATRSRLGAVLYETHEVLGLGVLGILIAHWLWQLTGHVRDGLGALFPWFSTTRLKQLKQATMAVLRGDLWTERSRPLASAIHGLGLLVATGLAVSGAILFVNSVELAEEIHEVLGTLMWVYLVGHVGLAVLHEWRDHMTIRRMFNLRQAKATPSQGSGNHPLT